ncbi:hypothetical protein [Youngiibacter multivorans]|uniref:YggT family protein n=1 Tax=Youngiibacter multivorans TaxID=937251 RepID=A0ABS4FZF1_9CLOT|nr:hypothetical protein [Youngiibacter multivorans]MBP1917680.1 hypothetical protein [Youngiibacter multivorans]
MKGTKEMSNQTRLAETRNTKNLGDSRQTIIGITFGVIQVVLALRLGFKLLGSNPNNQFVGGIYSVTKYIVSLFEVIFDPILIKISGISVIFEPATLISMMVFGLIGWVAMKTFAPRSFHRYERTRYIDDSFDEDEE